MSNILDSMMKPHAFLPESVAEYTALQLAKKLDDADRVLRYVALLDRHALPLIVEAFISSQARHPAGNPAVAFDEELQALRLRGHSNEF